MFTNMTSNHISKHSSFFISVMNLGSIVILLILSSSFTGLNPRKSAINLAQEKSFNPSSELPTFYFQLTMYFHKIYYGNGMDHMNINLVNINLSGLMTGDEIGIFDGVYCVGSTIIEEQNMQDNNLSIPASANDTIESSPNGYIEGHKVTLEVYRVGIVYPLNFQTVNNSQDIFQKRGSMFALVDFPQLTELSVTELSEEIRIFPNPFNGSLTIEITLPHPQNLNCEIIDLNGQLVSTLFNGEAEEHISLIWDGADNNKKQVPS